MFRNLATVTLMAAAIAACNQDNISGPLSSESSAALESRGSSSPGVLYVLSNAAAGNSVLAFPRGNDGALSGPQSFPTGGNGSGAGLGSAGAVVLSDNGQWLIAVNAGSNSISAFRVSNNDLALTDVIASGGTTPISVTISGNVVYALNAGGVNNISGFRLSKDGALSAIPGSTRPLSAASPGPAQVAFTPDGDRLVVTEKGTNMILTYDVSSHGVASAPSAHPAAGTTPFGFAFAKHDVLVVSEAFGGAATASAASSYSLKHDSFSVVTGSALTTETSACWTTVSTGGRFAYVANTGSGTVTGYDIGNKGQLTRLDSDGVTGVTGAGSAPADLGFDSSGRFLYVRNGGNGTISVFRFGNNGSLTAMPVVTGLPAGAVGLAAD